MRFSVVDAVERFHFERRNGKRHAFEEIPEGDVGIGSGGSARRSLPS